MIVANSALTSLGMGMSALYMIRYARLNGVGSELWGFISTASLAAMITLSLLLIPLVDRVDRRALMSLGGALMSMGAASFSVGTLTAMFMVMVLLRVGLRVQNAGWFGYANDMTPKPLRSRLSALAGFASSIASSVGGLIGGLVYPISPQLIFVAAPALMAANAVIALMIPGVMRAEG